VLSFDLSIPRPNISAVYRKRFTVKHDVPASGTLKAYMYRQTHECCFFSEAAYLFALVNMLLVLVVFSFCVESLPDKNIKVVLANAE